MKLATYQTIDSKIHFGVLTEKGLVDLHEIAPEMPDNALDFISENENYMSKVPAIIEKSKNFYDLKDVNLLPPLPNPVSFRDFMGFTEHHENCRRNQNQTVDPLYYEIPVFYFSNTKNMLGMNEKIRAPKKTKQLDFEFEVGFIIGKAGIDISKEKAEEHIFGFTILNDWSARDLQANEMKIKLGPAKGKDFGTSMGPFTIDELNPYRVKGSGLKYDMKTYLFINGELIRENNLNTIFHDFAGAIERASEDVKLYPGELFGSGTIGGGCILEYGGKLPWLKSGDFIEMEIEGLGKLVSYVE